MILLIGFIIGIVMGLTGAGGSLVAIPLFMHFLGLSLKEATLFSLIAVVIASFSQYFFQRKNSKVSLALKMTFFSGIGSFLSLPYKKLIPEIGIAILLTVISLYSLWSIWRDQKSNLQQRETDKKLTMTVLIGFSLGLLTTLTGLGGGVLMLPILLNIYQLEPTKAVATSLLIVGLSSLSSLSLQLIDGEAIKTEMNLPLLAVAILVTSYLTKMLIQKMKPEKMVLLRKLVFTLIVIMSLLKMFFR